MTKALRFIINLIFVLVAIFAIGKYYPTDSLLIKPWDWTSIIGVFTSSFVHESIDHLIYNSLALIVFYFFLIKENQLRKPIIETVVLVVFSNILVFMIGNPTYYYLGSSNLVYALLGYSLGLIIYERQYLFLIPISLLGGMLLSGLIIQVETISYLSHYLGVLTGFGYFNYQYFFKYREYRLEGSEQSINQT